LGIRRLGLAAVKYGLLAVALLATVSLSALVTMRAVLSSRVVTVPDLSGRRVREAGAMAATQGLQVRVEGKRHHPDVPVDRVAAQEPGPGSSLKASRSIRIWLSLGPRRVNVPPLEGQSLRSARLALHQAQVPLGRVAEVTSPDPEGTVLLQRPPAGEADDLGLGVSLLVSRGPAGPDYLMPDLIGRPSDQVLPSLQLAGWRPAVQYRSYPGIAPGIVLRQRPASGHRVGPRAGIALEISGQ